MTAKRRGLVLYASPSCPACITLKPHIERLVQKHGLSIESRNSDTCHMKGSNDPVCQKIKAVPAVVYNGREVKFKSFAELNAKLEKLKKRK